MRGVTAENYFRKAINDDNDGFSRTPQKGGGGDENIHMRSWASHRKFA